MSPPHSGFACGDSPRRAERVPGPSRPHAVGRPPDGQAIVYCDGALGSTNGKTAHGLLRRSERYVIVAVVDRDHAGADAGEVFDGRPIGVPVCANVQEAIENSRRHGRPATHLVVGLAPDGGRLSARAREDIKSAIRLRLHVDCGLHDFLGDDPELGALAARHGVVLRDVRRTPPRGELHSFTGKIEQVTCLKVAVLGTDSAVGKRTTAWKLVDGLRAAGVSAELVGTGQTAWLQGARYSLMLDSLVSDFMAGEIEHAVFSAFNDLHPEVIVIEGQGSLMNPAYPGGYEILAAGRPDVVVLQHAPARKEYDGFPGYPIHPIKTQIAALQLVSGRPVIAITINHEGLNDAQRIEACRELRERTGLPVCDVLLDGPDVLVAAVRPHLRKTIPVCR